MSLNDDCELQDLVKKTLEKSGSMSKIRVSYTYLVFYLHVYYNISFKTNILKNIIKDCLFCNFQAELRANVFLALEENGCLQVNKVI